MYPNGVTSKIVQERYELDYHNAVAILRDLGDTGAGAWIKSGHHVSAKILMPPGTPETASILAPNQAAMMQALRHACDRDGIVQLPVKELARLARVPTGSAPQILLALERKDRIMLSRPSDGTAPPIYQVLEQSKENAL